MIVFAMLACGSAAQPTAPPELPPPTTVDGLAFWATSPPTAHAGEVLPVELHVRNDGAEPRRLYLIEPEPFRAPTSAVMILRSPDRPPTYPEMHPHGYLPRESDFRLIEPGAELVVAQPVPVPADLPRGTHRIAWSYQNGVDRWPGGVMTMDGPTEPLFGGGPIPGMFVGDAQFYWTFEVVGR